MEPDREWRGRATLVDLLDRVFDKGVIIHADLIISVAGIPLIGVTLKAALAGMETMLAYGMLQDMDVKSRMWEAQHRKNNQVPLMEGEEVALKMFGSYYYSKGIYRAWKSGYFYLTNFRLLLYQQDMAEVVFQTPLEKITAMRIRREKSFTGKNKDIIYLALEGGKIVRLNALQTQQFIEKLRELQEKIGVSLGELPAEELDETTNKFLMDGEKVCYQGRMWHLRPKSGVMGEIWKPGHLYLTNKRLCWWYEFEGKLLFQVPVDKITGAIQERRNLSVVLTDKKVLDVIYYSNNGSKIVASFSGKE
ncbi:hypothetical protein E3J84_03505, partial [Candidatus Aerophobetes bacterium]